MASSTMIPAPVGWPAGITVETDGSLLDGLSGAAFSPDKAYRYVLTRTWDAAAPAMTWIMLNPSTADAMKDDPTIRRCVQFARRERCGRIGVVNLFGFRATDPRSLSLPGRDPVGPANDRFLEMHTRKAALVVAAWGVGGALNGRAREVGQRLAAAGVQLWCLGVTKDGHPKHPLARGRERVPDDAPLIPWQVPS
jgi:hypothetical protein